MDPTFRNDLSFIYKVDLAVTPAAPGQRKSTVQCTSLRLVPTCIKLFQASSASLSPVDRQWLNSTMIHLSKQLGTKLEYSPEGGLQWTNSNQ